MSIFAYECKSQLKSFVSWTVGLIGGFLLFVAAFYGAFMESKAAVEQAISNLPPAFAAVFGVEVKKMFTFGGFFQFAYTYLSLAGAIMAAVTGIAVFSREKRNKCADFLFVKPIRRSAVFGQKLLSAVTLLAAFNVLYIAAVLAVYAINGTGEEGYARVALAGASLFFVQMVFLGAAVLFAALARKVRSVSGAGMAMGFAGFLVMALHSITEEEAVRWISPLEYFSPTDALATGGFTAKYALAGVIVAVVCLAVAFWRYCRSDARAV